MRSTPRAASRLIVRSTKRRCWAAPWSASARPVRSRRGEARAASVTAAAGGVRTALAPLPRVDAACQRVERCGEFLFACVASPSAATSAFSPGARRNALPAMHEPVPVDSSAAIDAWIACWSRSDARIAASSSGTLSAATAWSRLWRFRSTG